MAKFVVTGKEKDEPKISLRLVPISSGVAVMTEDGWTIGTFKDNHFERATGLKYTAVEAAGVKLDSAGRIEVV